MRKYKGKFLKNADADSVENFDAFIGIVKWSIIIGILTSIGWVSFNILSFSTIYNYGFQQYYNNVIHFNWDENHYLLHSKKVYAEKIPIKEIKKTKPIIILGKGRVFEHQGYIDDDTVTWTAVRFYIKDKETFGYILSAKNKTISKEVSGKFEDNFDKKTYQKYKNMLYQKIKVKKVVGAVKIKEYEENDKYDEIDDLKSGKNTRYFCKVAKDCDLADEIYDFWDDSTHQDIAIFLPYCTNILAFNKSLKSYSHLIIKVLAGDVLSWQSYQRLNINHACKVLLLDHEDTANENIKISRFILTNKNFTNHKLDFVIDAELGVNPKRVYDSVFQNRQKQLFLVQSDNVLKQIISRTLVNYDYFALFSHLLSFVGWEFHTIDAAKICKRKIKFSQAVLGQKQAILVGIITGNGVNLNPPKDSFINSKQDKLILIAESNNAYNTKNKINRKIKTIAIKRPSSKEHKKIYIIGNEEHLKLNSITEFLSDESIKKCKKIIRKDNDYAQKKIWDEIVADKPDIVILDLEDEQEFVLTMYLRNLYSENKQFLSSIINIIHNPDIATLMIGADIEKNIIISERLIAKYLTQFLFNPQLPAIFNELTSTTGSEFYILQKPKYNNLFKMDYAHLRANLMDSGMIYIGVFDESGEFIFNSKDIQQAFKIVVLCEGD